MVKQGRGSAYQDLLKDPNVKRWYDNVARGSIITADVYLRRLGNYCLNNKTTPAKFAKLSGKEAYDVLLDNISKLEADGKAGSYIVSIINALRSWLSFRDVVITKKIKISGSEDTPSLKKERVPTIEELKSILFSGDKKTRAICILMAHAGLRIESIGDYLGKGGLQVNDLPEMKIGGSIVEFEHIPTMVRVRAEISKSGKDYLTFLSDEGCGYLKDYLEERIRKGEAITGESALIAPKVTKKAFITTTKVAEAIRKAIRKAGFPWRPYVLRSFFASQMMLAESQGKSLRDYRSFWMGHVGDIEHVYTLNKGVLGDQVIEDMRSAYKKGQDLLQTTSLYSQDAENYLAIAKKTYMELFGIDSTEIETNGYQDLPMDQLRKIIEAKDKKQIGPTEPKEKCIPLKEVGSYLEKGWIFVTKLSDTEVIVRRPNGEK